MGKEFKTVNPQFIFEHNKKPIKNAYIYIDLPGTPENDPAFEISEFKTDTSGKLGFLKEPDGTVFRIRDKEYNIFYSYKKIEDTSSITEDKCQRVKMLDVVKLTERTSDREKIQERSHPELDFIITIYDEGDGRYGFYVTNNEPDYIDMRFYFTTPASPDVDFDDPSPEGKATKDEPYKRIVSPNTSEEHFLDLITDDEVAYEFDSYAGDPNATSDGTLYALPYKTGEEFTVIQGFNGSKSHKSNLRYAVDFDMEDEENDIVCAARSGKVVLLEDGVSGTAPISDKNPGNFIRILHTDRTYGYYIHLRNGGVLVSKGDSVNEGDEIAHPDNTGSSESPHLHFDVRKANGSNGWRTIPWQFKDSSGDAFTPEEGKKYKK